MAFERRKQRKTFPRPPSRGLPSVCREPQSARDSLMTAQLALSLQSQIHTQLLRKKRKSDSVTFAARVSRARRQQMCAPKRGEKKRRSKVNKRQNLEKNRLGRPDERKSVCVCVWKLPGSPSLRANARKCRRISCQASYILHVLSQSARMPPCCTTILPPPFPLPSRLSLLISLFLRQLGFNSPLYLSTRFQGPVYTYCISCRNCMHAYKTTTTTERPR